MTPTEAALLGVAISAVASLIIGLYTARKGAASNRQISGDGLIQKAVDQMREDIDSQASQITALRTEVDGLKVTLASRDRIIRAAAIFIDNVGLWLTDGMKRKRPTPSPHLYEYIDPSLWDEPEA